MPLLILMDIFIKSASPALSTTSPLSIDGDHVQVADHKALAHPCARGFHEISSTGLGAAPVPMMAKPFFLKHPAGKRSLPTGSLNLE